MYHHAVRPSVVLAVCLCTLPPCVAFSEDGHGDAPSPSDVLNGKLHAVSEQLDATIDNLRVGRLKEFVGSYRNLTTAYVCAAEEIQTAFESASFALARIQFTRQVTAHSASPDGSRASGRSLDGVRELRTALLRDLDNARAAFAAAKSAEEGRRHLGQIAVAVERIEQLDALLSADESKPSAVKLSDLSQSLAQLESELRAEQRQLEVQSIALSGLLRDLMTQVAEALKVLELDSKLPYDRLAELQRVRRGVHRLVESIHSTRRATSSLVEAAYARRPTTMVAHSQQLLSRAKSLLQTSQRSPTE